MIPVWRVGNRRIRATNIYVVGWNYAEHNREVGREFVVPPNFFQKSPGRVARPELPGFLAIYDFSNSPSRSINRIEVRRGTGYPYWQGWTRYSAGECAGAYRRLCCWLRPYPSRCPAQNSRRRRTQVPCQKLSQRNSRWHICPSYSACRNAFRPLTLESEWAGSAIRAFAICRLLSSIVNLLPGDLIFTGTPMGTGILGLGDTVDFEITGLTALRVRVI